MIWQAVASYINEACGNVIRQEDQNEDLEAGEETLELVESDAPEIEPETE